MNNNIPCIISLLPYCFFRYNLVFKAMDHEEDDDIYSGYNDYNATLDTQVKFITDFAII